LLTCKACTATPDDCPGVLVCTTSGACGNCASAANCVTPTSPICDPGTTQCRACQSNQECVAQTGKPYCVGQTCGPCVPGPDTGCTDPTKPDCRGALGGGVTCQPCTSSAHCTGKPGTPACDTNTGRCVACANDNDCSTNAKAPFCVNNVCAACDSVSPLPAVSDLRCALKPGGEPACVRAGTYKGECAACDPGGSRGCTQNQLCCEGSGAPACVATTTQACSACTSGACNPLLANNCANRACRCGTGAACTGTGDTSFCISGACRECRSDADCGNAAEPLCEGNVCVRCDQAVPATGRCAAKTPGTVCAASGAFAGRCAACDPLTHAGCGTGTLNQCSPTTSTCVDCVDDGGCSGALDQCNTATSTCVDCLNDQGCSGTLGQCNVAQRTCVDCMNDLGCSGTLDQCDVTAHACVDCDATGGCTGTLDRCVVASNTCVDCDATGGCNVATLPVCDLNTCRACQSDAECAALLGASAPLCSAGGACVPDSPCTSPGDCTDANHPVCFDDGMGTAFCRRCDPVTGAGCGPAQTCTAGFACVP
jgi:hypothetical protein